MPPNTHFTQDLTNTLARIDRLPGVGRTDRALLEIAAILAFALPPIIAELISYDPPSPPIVKPFLGITVISIPGNKEAHP